jgi:ATP/ADP translocase
MQPKQKQKISVNAKVHPLSLRIGKQISSFAAHMNLAIFSFFSLKSYENLLFCRLDMRE